MQKLHPDLFAFLRSIRAQVFPGEVVTILGVEVGPVLLFDTAPIEFTARRLLFSRRHHSQNPGGRVPYGPRYWGYDSTKYAETTQLLFQMPPAMVREEPENA